MTGKRSFASGIVSRQASSRIRRGFVLTGNGLSV